MDFQTAVRTVFSKYATFSGRASRSEFWWWTLFTIIASFIASAIDVALGYGVYHQAGGPVSLVWGLAVFLPGLAVAVRRLHDIGRSGWWYLILFVPLIGWLMLLYWWTRPSEPGSNRFG